MTPAKADRLISRPVPNCTTTPEGRVAPSEPSRSPGVDSADRLDADAPIRAVAEGDPEGPCPEPPEGIDHGPDDAEAPVEIEVERPTIVIREDEMAVNDEAIRALTADPTLYCRGHYLVTVQRDHREARLVNRPTDSPRIAAISDATLRERMSHHAQWVEARRKPRTVEFEMVPAHPPGWSVKAVQSRGQWEGIRHLEGLIEAPAILADGSILDRPGYDERSSLLYEPNAEFPPIPERITQADAREAAMAILEVVADFPFGNYSAPAGQSS